MSMRIGSKSLAAAILGFAAFLVSSEADAAGAGAIGGGFGPSALAPSGGVVAGRGGFVGSVPYGYRGHHHRGWRGAHGYRPQQGRWGQGRYGYGYGRYGYGYGYGGVPYAYGGGAYPYPVDPPPSQPVIGIPPSPVAPPAIYVIGPKDKSVAQRRGAKGSVSASSYSVGGQSSGAVVTRVSPGGYRMN